MTSPTPTPLSYANPPTDRRWWPTAAYYLSLAAVGLPLIVGVVGTAGWMLTRHSAFQYVCFLAFLGMVGGWFLALPTMLAFLFFSASDPRKMRRGTLVLITAIATFFTSLGCMALSSYSRIKVVNRTNAAIARFALIDPTMQSWTIDEVAPGETRRRWVDFGGEGSVTFTANVGNTPASGMAVGYITSGGPLNADDATITFEADGSVMVKEGE